MVGNDEENVGIFSSPEISQNKSSCVMCREGHIYLLVIVSQVV